MKSTFRALVFVSTLALSGAAAFAQSSDPTANIQQGKLSFSLNSDLMSSLTTSGISVAYKGYSNSARKGIGFDVVAGTMDLANGVGEVASAGSLTLTQGASQITLKSFMLDTSSATPFLSAIVLVNGRSAGRQSVFQLVSANPFAAPLQYGEYVTGTTYFKVAPMFTSEINDYFTGTAFGSETVIGSFSLDVLLSMPAS